MDVYVIHPGRGLELPRKWGIMMKRFGRWFWQKKNAWIVLGLFLANGIAWLGAGADEGLVQVEPRLDPQVAFIRDKMLAGQSLGETFAITITEPMAAEGIAWFLDRHPDVPFGYPGVDIGPGGVTGRGMVDVAGLRTRVYGRARIGLQDGAPVVTIEEIGVAGVPLPGWMMDIIRSEVEARFDFEKNPLPLYITRLELGDGVMKVEGRYR